MIYRRRPSPLHAARAAAGCAYCLALAVAALTLTAPTALGAVAISVVAGGVAAGVGRELARASEVRRRSSACSWRRSTRS